MKHLYIIGARGFGRAIYELAEEINQERHEFVIEGFLDDKKDALDEFEGYPPIISSVENFIPSVEDVFICALGDVKYKKKYIEIIKKKGGVFCNLIHPTAVIGKNSKLGTGCILRNNVRISCDVKIGDFNTFQPFVVVGHDVRIDNYSMFNTFAFLGGYVDIEEGVTVHTGGIIHPRKHIGANSVVGAGAVVIRNVARDTTVYGNPAKKL